MTGLSFTALLTVALQGAAPPRPSPGAFGPVVSAEWLSAHLHDRDLVVLHVGYQQREYDRGHIPGARFLQHQAIAPERGRVTAEFPGARDALAAFAAVGVGRASRVVVYGEPMAAARAWATLDWAGLGDRAAVLDGGLDSWHRAGYPTTTEAPAPAPDVAPPPPPGPPDRLVDAEWLAARLADTTVVLLDARPDDEYTGTDGGHGGAHLAGHIPGARQLYWEELLVSSTDRRLRPDGELDSLLQRAGARRDRTLVVYCMIGLRASVLYLAARMLGYDVRFYDGSWQDWSHRHLPVEPGRPSRPDPRPAPRPASSGMACSPPRR